MTYPRYSILKIRRWFRDGYLAIVLGADEYAYNVTFWIPYPNPGRWSWRTRVFRKDVLDLWTTAWPKRSRHSRPVDPKCVVGWQTARILNKKIDEERRL